MSSQYGTALTWSTVNAPHLFSGICENYQYNRQQAQELVPGEQEIAAIIHHGLYGDISYDATITNQSSDFPLIQNGIQITVGAVAGGIILISDVEESWAIRQPKKASLKAKHFPDMVGSGAAAATIAANTPNQTAPFIRPAGKVIYGTQGLSTGFGIVQSLKISQNVSIETDEDTDGKIKSAWCWKYLRKLSLEVLATGGRPAENSTLSVNGAPNHAVGYIIQNVSEKYSIGGKKSYSIEGIWAPCLA